MLLPGSQEFLLLARLSPIPEAKKKCLGVGKGRALFKHTVRALSVSI